MNLRFAGMITGCMLVGASAAAYHRADSRPAPSGATLAAATPELPTPLFLQAATGAPTSAAWPPVTSVAFYEEMFEQLPAATAPTAAQAETPPAAAPQVVARCPARRRRCRRSTRAAAPVSRRSRRRAAPTPATAVSKLCRRCAARKPRRCGPRT